MKTYTIPVQWVCRTEIKVEANSLKEAVEIALKPSTINNKKLEGDILEVEHSVEVINMNTLDMNSAEDIEYIKELGVY
ncbi:MAG: hypothetical protein KF816_06440 [Melioribacteraceae bacterium]|nr:hypothetical protein [Melioribacteraceae bacterium]